MHFRGKFSLAKSQLDDRWEPQVVNIAFQHCAATGERFAQFFHLSGTQFNRKTFWLKFRLEKRIEIPFLSRDMSKLAIFEHFLSMGNLKPKLEWFFKPNVFH